MRRIAVLVALAVLAVGTVSLLPPLNPLDTSLLATADEPPRGAAGAEPPPGRGAGVAGPVGSVPSLDPATIAALVADPEKEATEAAKRALARAGATAVPVLLDALLGDDESAAAGARAGLRVFPGESIPALLGRLSDSDPMHRRRATEVLADISGWWEGSEEGALIVQSVSALLPAAGDDEADACLYLLDQAGSDGPRALPNLAQCLGRAEGRRLFRAAAVASRMGEDAASLAPVLLERALRPEAGADEVQTMFSALGAVGPGNSGAVARLASLLPTAPEPLRISALGALRAFGAQSSPAIEGIASLLRDRSRPVREAALQALLMIPGSGAMAAQFALEATDRFSSEPRYVLELLGPRFGEALPVLLSAACGPDPERRAESLKLLAACPPEFSSGVAAAAYRGLADEEPRVRAAAAWCAFGRDTPLPGEAEQLARALENSEATVRRAAAWTIGRRAGGSRDLAKARMVARLLDDPDPEVRFVAGNAMAEIGVVPPESLPHIRKCLRSPDRDPRLGAARAAETLGPAAAPAVPDLIFVILDTDGGVGQVALAALAATGVMDDVVRAFLEELAGDRSWMAAILRAFGPRAHFLEATAREQALGDSHNDLLGALAKATRDPAELAGWIAAHEDELDHLNALEAYEGLGAPGVEGCIRLTRSSPVQRRVAREHTEGLGAAAAAPVLRVALAGDAGAAGSAAELLTSVRTGIGLGDLLPLLDSRHATVRAGAAKAIAAFLPAGAATEEVVAKLAGMLEDEAVVRAEVLHALAAAGSAPAAAVERARTALDDPDVRVRVAAADAVFVLTGDSGGPLRALREVFTRPLAPKVFFGGSSAPPLTEDDFTDEEQAWAEAAKVLERMGPTASPLAVVVSWAAIRSGWWLLDGHLVEAVAAMGPGAAEAIPLLLALRRYYERCSYPPGNASPAVEAIDRALAALRRR